MGVSTKVKPEIVQGIKAKYSDASNPDANSSDLGADECRTCRNHLRAPGEDGGP
jgi:hypothetical protein